MTGKLAELRNFCVGHFKDKADFFKEYACSWRENDLLSCKARLFIAGCSSELSNETLESIKIICVYTQGCTDHREGKPRGYVQCRAQTFSVKTADGLCKKNFTETDPVAIIAKNNTFGYSRREPARKALSRQRKLEFTKGDDIVHSITIHARTFAVSDFHV